MSDQRPAQVADLAWRMFAEATKRVPEPQRESIRKLVRTYGEAKYDAGRAHESELIDRRELELAQKEFQIRVRERALA